MRPTTRTYPAKINPSKPRPGSVWISDPQGLKRYFRDPGFDQNTVQDSGKRNTVKSHIKALGLYNFIRDFGWANKRGGGAYIRGLYKRNKKCFVTTR